MAASKATTSHLSQGLDLEFADNKDNAIGYEHPEKSFVNTWNIELKIDGRNLLSRLTAICMDIFERHRLHGYTFWHMALDSIHY